MKSLLSKSFLIGLLVTVLAIFVVSFKEIKMFFNTQISVLGESEQKVLLDESKPQLVPSIEEEYEVAEKKGTLQVPMIWKYEIISNNGTNNAIHGYIPNLEEYRRWYEYVYEDIRELKSIEKVKKIDYINLDTVSGIANKSDEFAFKEDTCMTIKFGEKNIGICPSWINLSNETIANKSYILVRCSQFDDIQNMGYCLFEDYRRIYYNYSKDMDTECLQENKTLVYCNIESYFNILD
jgi:hypothetical protein